MLCGHHQFVPTAETWSRLQTFGCQKTQDRQGSTCHWGSSSQVWGNAMRFIHRLPSPITFSKLVSFICLAARHSLVETWTVLKGMQLMQSYNMFQSTKKNCGVPGPNWSTSHGGSIQLPPSYFCQSVHGVGQSCPIWVNKVASCVTMTFIVLGCENIYLGDLSATFSIARLHIPSPFHCVLNIQHWSSLMFWNSTLMHAYWDCIDCTCKTTSQDHAGMHCSYC